MMEEKFDIAKLYEESLVDLKEGQIVRGKIIIITKNDVIVDIGYKSEGFVSLSEFPDPESIKIGDEIEVMLESMEDEHGRIMISKERAERALGWERVIAQYGEEDVVDGRVARKVKGGFMVDIGMEAFLPASLAALKTAGAMGSIVGQTFPFKIIKINKARKNIVVSRKAVIMQQRDKDRKVILEQLEKGTLAKGIVRNITDFGVFIDLGGNITGLLHITEMSWGRVSHPSEMLAIGDEVEVMILDFDKEQMKVSLGLKQKTQNPWENIDTKYTVDSKVVGKVVNIMPYGAFIELEKGVEGLMHISGLSWTKKYKHPSEVLAIGDKIEAVVLGIDKASQKISLGMKQLESNPWDNVETKFPVGTKVKGKIRNMTDYGAFMELEEGIDGLIHISDISWTKRISHPKDVFKKGEKIDAVVLAVDAGNRRISLGIKQIVPDPWDEIAEKYKTGDILDGTVTKIANFGLFVEIEPDLEGLAHVSEINITEGDALEGKYKPGDQVRVKIMRVDSIQRKIALSLKSEEQS
ncbi:MAG: 30S ribosomal protein S1 [Candidatus Omnitrophota bacterium]